MDDQRPVVASICVGEFWRFERNFPVRLGAVVAIVCANLFMRDTIIVVNGLLLAGVEVRGSPRAMMSSPRSRATIAPPGGAFKGP